MVDEGKVPPTSAHLGLDLGATNLKWAVVSRTGDRWELVAHDQEPTPVTAGPAGIIAELGRLAGRLARQEPWPGGPLRSVGIGVPGLYDPRRGTTRFLPNIPGDWRGLPVADPVAAACGLPTALINDARAFGLAELRLGAGRGYRSMVGLTLGTGVGGVIAIDGRVIQGRDGTAGEIGHQTIDPDGPICGCGNRGCLEAYARADQIALRCGTPTVEAAVRAAEAGDQRALAGLSEVGRYLGIGIANVITLITPDVVVLGGGVSQAGELLFGPIRAELRRRVTVTPLDAVQLVPAALGIWAGAVGAAIHGAEVSAAAQAGEGDRAAAPGGASEVVR
jgi:glucokinase